MSEITFYLADDVFDLNYLPSGNIPLAEYDLKTPTEKLRLHEESLVKEIKAQLQENFQIETAVGISSIKPAKGIQVIMLDFNISVFIAEDVTAAVEDAIYFHRGSMLGFDDIDITMHATLKR